jgi:hypothetical protein
MISGKAHDVLPGVDELIRKCSTNSFARSGDSTIHVNGGDVYVATLCEAVALTTSCFSR